ncbi:hypothetical protein MKK64_03235 [Methylobacterium sp. E-025]|jgi:hypothetical protein|nr:hypothetical protein [Methylobacterium sp. WL6]MCJ2041689.1 hypothetical protein [Methylobacterium sp. J-059]MCJ2110234.1 hypothetical protein [Methylobacterium sp. E-025]TXN61658.1 hypothetical protein FV230_23350 [Methylobacterium sp. WL6]
MTLSDLDKPADLTIWPRGMSPRRQEGHEFRTLREALTVAIDALRDPRALPWIVTEEGHVLSPDWIAANGPAARTH